MDNTRYGDLPRFWQMVEQVKAKGKIKKDTLETTKNRQKTKCPNDK